jgi:hypothetical protein
MNRVDRVSMMYVYIKDIYMFSDNGQNGICRNIGQVNSRLVLTGLTAFITPSTWSNLRLSSPVVDRLGLPALVIELLNIASASKSAEFASNWSSVMVKGEFCNRALSMIY